MPILWGIRPFLVCVIWKGSSSLHRHVDDRCGVFPPQVPPIIPVWCAQGQTHGGRYLLFVGISKKKGQAQPRHPRKDGKQGGRGVWTVIPVTGRPTAISGPGQARLEKPAVWGHSSVQTGTSPSPRLSL